MAVDIVMPQMGESIFEGTITKWLKKPGDKVERDEPLFEISTDKVDAEIPSPSAGVLKEIKFGEGQTVPIQTVVGVIDAVGSPTAAAAAAPAAQRPAASTGERIHSSPLVRRMAKEHGIDLSTVVGTGAGGRVSKQDIEAVIAGTSQPTTSARASRPSAPLVMPPPSSPAVAPAPPGVSGG